MTDSPPTRTTDSLAPDQRTRRATDNRSLVDDRGPDTDVLLPELDAGITLLEIEGGRGVPVLQSLVLDRLLMNDGHVYWVDARGYATTTALARLAPSSRLLDRIHVARGFTAYQHYSAVQDLQAAVSETVRSESNRDPVKTVRDRRLDGPASDDETGNLEPTLIVAPSLDTFYRANETLSAERTKTLLSRALARLSRYAEGYDVPVVVTRSTDDEFAAPIEARASNRLQCKRTSLGPRFVGDDFETRVYPVGDGEYYQTTLAYWRELLAHRAEQAGLQQQSPRTTAPENSRVGIGATVDGPTTMTADPVADALSGPGTGGW